MPSPESPPLSLYVHLPWCIRKCPYCDFNSHELKGGLDDDRYIDSLLIDLQNSLSDHNEERPLESIFFGGGTPSLFSGYQLGRVISQARESIGFRDGIEITMEANPGSLEHDEFDKYLAGGINRLSMGIQSFDDQNLHRLGRIHDSRTAIKAVGSARSAGFDNINLDLMFGLPGQDAAGSISDCMQALELNPAHLSFYQLTIEPNTLFFRHPPELPGESKIMEIQCALIDLLSTAGYDRYEVSAYAQPGQHSRHNMNYWEFGDYLGIGAGAHSKLTLDGRIMRSSRRKNPVTWMNAIQAGAEYESTHEVEGQDLLFEFMLNALRLRSGITLTSFQERTGMDRTIALDATERARNAGLVTVDADRLFCTDRGYLLIDEILQDLLPESEN